MDEDYNAGDKCGRCGCARRDHTPGLRQPSKMQMFLHTKGSQGEEALKMFVDTILPRFSCDQDRSRLPSAAHARSRR